MSRRYDAVVVGSGINSLVAGALLAKAGWSVCVLERNELARRRDPHGRDHRARVLHEVFASWHPLFTGSAAYAELKDDLARARARVPEHRAADRDAVPGRRSVFLTTSPTKGEVDELGPGAGKRGRPSRFLPNADLAFGVLSTELWSRDGMRLGGEGTAQAGPARAGRVRRRTSLSSCRDWTAETFEDERAHGLFAPVGAAHRARAGRGVLRVHGPGDRGRDRARRDAGAARRRRAGSSKRSRGIIRDSGGACETGSDVERILVSGGRGDGRAH